MSLYLNISTSLYRYISVSVYRYVSISLYIYIAICPYLSIYLYPCIAIPLYLYIAISLYPYKTSEVFSFIIQNSVMLVISWFQWLISTAAWDLCPPSCVCVCFGWIWCITPPSVCYGSRKYKNFPKFREWFFTHPYVIVILKLPEN